MKLSEKLATLNLGGTYSVTFKSFKLCLVVTEVASKMKFKKFHLIVVNSENEVFMEFDGRIEFNHEYYGVNIRSFNVRFCGDMDISNFFFTRIYTQKCKEEKGEFIFSLRDFDSIFNELLNAIKEVNSAINDK